MWAVKRSFVSCLGYVAAQVSEQERLLMEAEARDSGEQLREMAEKVRIT